MRAPALRFAVAGALLFALLDWPPPVPATRPAAAASDEELLLDLALAAELDRSDPLVRDRLLTLARFLDLAPGAEPGLREREARALGLTRSDPIIRRHLVHLMQLNAGALPPKALPDEATLRAFYDERHGDLALPERVRLRHVYLSRDRRGAAAGEQAAALLSSLRRGETVAGDPFARGSEVGPATRDELARVFGAGFAEQAMALSPGEWSGPIDSAYGVHLVRIESRLAGGPPAFEAVRGQLLHAWLREQQDERLAQSLAALRTK